MARVAKGDPPVDDVGPVSTEYVDVQALRPVGRRLPLAPYVRELWRRRAFIVADSKARTFTSNKDFLLGNLWLIGRPLIDGATYYVIFGMLLGASRGIDNFIGFLLIGIFLFGYSARSLTTSVSAISTGKNLIRTFAFPRAVIPLAGILREAFATVPTVLTMVVLLLTIPPRAPITTWWLLFPVALLLQTLVNLGLGLYAARFGALVPDSKVAISFFTRIWMYGSGVMFSLENLTDNHPVVMAITQLNPLYCVLEISRDLLLYGKPGDPVLWVVLAAWAVVTPLLGFLYFWQGEEQYGRE
ncbi:ABC transporter permease [Janibacter sp. LM]|uniref:ABC transporter permease n=1 Tax=Janibacter sp. LM TaxID=3144845 RepID=UPI0031F70791